jgi:hypothetical protein
MLHARQAADAKVKMATSMFLSIIDATRTDVIYRSCASALERQCETLLEWQDGASGM